MKKINLSLSLSLSLFRKTFLIAFLFSMMNWANAQEFIKELENQFNVKIDSSFIKATPYKQYEKDGVIYDEDKKIDYYNNITIYEIKPNPEKSKGEVNREIEAIKPAIFMLPGGGFFGLSSSDIDGMDKLGNLSLGSKLSSNLTSEVFVIHYETNNINAIQRVVFPTNCTDISNQFGKAKLLEASYKAFRDLRKILKVNYLDSAAIKQIDSNNFFLIGSSAGAVLALNTLFLQKNEIQTPITYRNNCNDANSYGTPISITTDVINEYWPIPQMKGIISMSGAWIYDNISYLTSNNPSSSLNTPLFLMHGTCDEIISRREGNIGFKLPFNSFLQNLDANGRYINGKGSEYLFNTFKNIHSKMIYGQVKNGSHGIFSQFSLIPSSDPAWDVIEGAANSIDPVTTQIQPFINDIINGVNNLMTFTKVFNPEKASTKCKPFDNALDTICFFYIPTPNITYKKNICLTSTYTATLTNLPISPYSISWVATGNVVIVGSSSGSSIQYKKGTTGGTTGSLVATITRGCSTLPFSFPIVINGTAVNIINDIYISSACFDGDMGLGIQKFPAGTTATFSAVYPNAVQDGISTLEWELNCGVLISPASEYFVGNDLYSSILGFSQTPCTNVRVRYINECGATVPWVQRALKVQSCGLFGFSVYPNPSSDILNIKMEDGEELESDEGILVEIVDPMGNIEQKTIIKSTKEAINISELKPDVYKVVIDYNGEIFFTSFIKN